MEIHITLDELVPLATLQRLRSLFKSIIGIPMRIVDTNGTPMVSIDDPLNYCGAMVCGENGTLCLSRSKWDVPEPAMERAMRGGQQRGEPVPHRCQAGFRDAAVPIVVGDQTLGYVVFARSLAEAPDLEKFRRLAVKGGMAPEVGEQVARAALVMPEERIAEVSELVQIFAGLLASAAYDSIRGRKILELEELRDSLVYMIIHDLRTPLTTVIGGLQIVVDTQYDPEITQEFVPSALSGAGTLLEMINTLLDINKMEKGEMELDIEPVNPAEVSNAALVQVEGLARERNHELATNIDPACPFVPADKEKLRRVVTNLLANAIKFTPDGGHIRLAARPANGGLIFSVADDGPGIPEEDRERIFEKFGQVRSREHAQRYSTGLGLAFCKMVAEAHGGRIWVESVVGKGSTFSVSIPAQPADAAAN